MIKIDYRDARPIYVQVVDGIEGLALRGALPADTQLPSVRQLAMELSINPEHNTARLRRAGTPRRDLRRKGRGNFISDNAAVLRSQRLNELGEQITALAGQARARSGRPRSSCAAG